MNKLETVSGEKKKEWLSLENTQHEQHLENVSD